MPADGADDPLLDRDQIAERPGWRARLRQALSSANSALSYLIGLPIITLLGGLLLGYYQYLNAYQDKVSARAENDVKMATATYTEISKKFSEAQMLQQTMLANFSDALDDNTDADEQALATKHTKDAISPAYEKAWVELLEAGDVIAHGAQIYIDWATDFQRNPADPHFPNADPLSRSLLRTYDFDCNNNFPEFKPTEIPRERTTIACQVDRNQHFDGDDGFYFDLCPRHRDKASPETSVRIHWYSARHQVLTMHYCFHVLHQRLAKVRSWASKGEPSPTIKLVSRAEREQLRKEIDNQAARLHAFMGLALFQIEAIRVKYQPVGFACHIPLISPLISLLSEACTPIRTTPYAGFRRNSQQGFEDKLKLTNAVAPP